MFQIIATIFYPQTKHTKTTQILMIYIYIYIKNIFQPHINILLSLIF